MRKLLLLGVVVLSVVAASSAVSATTSVTITKAGFVPRDVTVNSGDTVTWTNTDTKAHRVVFDKLACNLTIQAGQQGSCTFVKSGKFNYEDPGERGGSFRGSVTVRPGVSITANPKLLVYGAQTTLSGSVSSAIPGERVTVQAKVCGTDTFVSVGTATSTTGGAWSLALKPTKITTYQAKWKSATSSQVMVQVKPRIVLRRLAAGKFSVRVLAAQSFAGKIVVFQRYSASTRRWSTVKRVTLRAGGTTTLPINPTTVSRRTFTAKVTKGVKVRASMAKTQTGACYAAGRSNVTRA